MPSAPTQRDLVERIAQLEARVARLEATRDGVETMTIEQKSASAGVVPPEPEQRKLREDALEFEVGQAWFGRVGIVALAIGGGYMLTLPYPAVSRLLPSAVGFGCACALFLLAHYGRSSFSLVASYIRGAAMALLYCSALRLFYFGAPNVFSPASGFAPLLLFGASAINLMIGWHRRSPRLFMLGVLSGCASAIAIGNARTLLPACVGLSAMIAVASGKDRWRPILPSGMMLVFATYFLWAVGNPAIGGGYQWAVVPISAPLFLLLCIAIFGMAPLWINCDEPDEPSIVVATLFSCVFGYGLFLLHTLAALAPHFVPLHIVASVTFLSLAALLWTQRGSQFSTFLDAMCGYAALSVAIVERTSLPDVLVWLSAESLLVVVTAIWFRSRFIVVTNFAIYAAVVAGYVVLNERETGVSIGFGVVALASARILNWQQRRLALKTELMRNAYLVCALAVFPYALAHLVPGRFVALSWIALAVVYYLLNFLIQNQKYRWMGHVTLLLTAVYLAVPGHDGMTPGYRIASFLALGGTLLAISLWFTQAGRSALGTNRQTETRS